MPVVRKHVSVLTRRGHARPETAIRQPGDLAIGQLGTARTRFSFIAPQLPCHPCFQIAQSPGRRVACSPNRPLAQLPNRQLPCGGLAGLWTRRHSKVEKHRRSGKRGKVLMDPIQGNRSEKSDRLSSKIQGRGTRRPAAPEGRQCNGRDRVRRAQHHARLGGGHHAPESR